MESGHKSSEEVGDDDAVRGDDVKQLLSHPSWFRGFLNLSIYGRMVSISFLRNSW